MCVEYLADGRSVRRLEASDDVSPVRVQGGWHKRVHLDRGGVWLCGRQGMAHRRGFPIVSARFRRSSLCAKCAVLLAYERKHRQSAAEIRDLLSVLDLDVQETDLFELGRILDAGDSSPVEAEETAD